jgi:hypothetical protein
LVSIKAIILDSSSETVIELEVVAVVEWEEDEEDEEEEEEEDGDEAFVVERLSVRCRLCGPFVPSDGPLLTDGIFLLI